MPDPEPATATATVRVHPSPGTVIACEIGRGPYALELLTGRHVLAADEPAGIGDDTGPSPYDLLAGALAACTTMTLRMYAQRKGWTLGRIHVAVHHAKVHAADCAACEQRAGRIDRFERVIEVDGSLSPEQRARLHEIADICPVHRTLEGSSLITTRVVPMKLP